VFKIALCKCPDSKKIIEEKIKSFVGTSIDDISVQTFENIEDFISSGIYFDVYFFHSDHRNDAGILVEHIEQNVQTKKSDGFSNESRGFLAFVDDPISESDCDDVIDCLQKYLRQDTMYFAVEFLTDKGLRSIALSRIVYFEFQDRKIKIKTQTAEYFCNDTLRNLFSLVGNFDFALPHKSFILNLRHIVSIKGYTIEMNDGSIVPLSQKKSKKFRDKYKDFLAHINAHPT